MIADIIRNHHKITTFEGDSDHAKVVEAVRKADIIDAYMGMLTMGMSKANIALVTATIPNAGFHKTLANFVPRLHGWNFPRGLYEVSKIFRW